MTDYDDEEDEEDIEDSDTVKEIVIYGYLVNGKNHKEYVPVEFSGFIKGKISYSDIAKIAPKNWYLIRRMGEDEDKVNVQIASRTVKAENVKTFTEFKRDYREYLKKQPVKEYKGKSHHAKEVKANRKEREKFKELYENE